MATLEKQPGRHFFVASNYVAALRTRLRIRHAQEFFCAWCRRLAARVGLAADEAAENNAAELQIVL
jgi:hypothetical protein